MTSIFFMKTNEESYSLWFISKTKAHIKNVLEQKVYQVKLCFFSLNFSKISPKTIIPQKKIHPHNIKLQNYCAILSFLQPIPSVKTKIN